MESHEANHEIEPSLTPPPPLLELPQRVTMALPGPNLFTNSTITTTIMTPATAQFPLLNMNTNPSPDFDSFINNINATITAPPGAITTTTMTPVTAQFPLLNMNTNPSPDFDSFINNINATITAPSGAITTTIMTPVTAQFPLLNMNPNPSSDFDSFNNSINATITAPPGGPSTTLMPCMTVMGDSSSHFPSDSGSVKKKRGRPRKYFVGNEVGLGSSSGSGQAQAAATPAAAAPHDSLVKSTKGRGRPRGSCNRKNDVEVFGGLVGTCFSPYVIIVNHGEDIIAKLTAACRGGSNSEVCILAAHGSVSTVALHRSGKITTYEGGQFEIVSLSGTLLPGNNNGDKRMGSWKVTLGGGPNAQLWGGVVADKLIAASTVKVILCSFTVNEKKASSSNQDPGPSMPSFEFASSGTPTDVVTTQGHLSESSMDNEDFPFDEELAAVFNTADQHISDMELYQHLWARHNEP